MKAKLARLLCLLGFHRWNYFSRKSTIRQCRRCYKVEEWPW